MSTVTFDTLAYSNRLQKSGVPREQAEAIAEANAEAFKDMAVSQQLATNTDIGEVKREIQDVKLDIQKVRNEMQDVKHELLKWMVTGMLAQTALLVGIIAFLK